MNRGRYRCLVVDDEALARELIESHLGKLKQFEVVASCASAIEASQELSENSIDLLFLDIEMPVLKGTDFYQNLRGKPKVIFTTAYREYALDGFELEAVDYLLKPITFPRFFKAIEKFLASERLGNSTESETLEKDAIFVRSDRKDVRLLLSDIVYVQGLKDYVTIHTQEKAFTVKETMSGIADRLGAGFVRVHRSYIVNRHRISALTRHDVEIGDIEIPIGDTYQAEAAKLLSKG
ncbi:MAG: LytTR family DNA-binding domain-containing protein [Pseudomonadota bacterium]